MKRYDADRAPDPAEWLALDEQERIILIEDHHRRTRAELPNPRLHAAIHAVVENQLAERLAVVRETLDRLMTEGLDRHNAIHAVGSVVAEHLWKAMNRAPLDLNAEQWYSRRLEALTADDWLKGAR